MTTATNLTPPPPAPQNAAQGQQEPLQAEPSAQALQAAQEIIKEYVYPETESPLDEMMLAAPFIASIIEKHLNAPPAFTHEVGASVLHTDSGKRYRVVDRLPIPADKLYRLVSTDLPDGVELKIALLEKDIEAAAGGAAGVEGEGSEEED